jgi:hypothetical protein
VLFYVALQSHIALPSQVRPGLAPLLGQGYHAGAGAVDALTMAMAAMPTPPPQGYGGLQGYEGPTLLSFASKSRGASPPNSFTGNRVIVPCIESDFIIRCSGT